MRKYLRITGSDSITTPPIVGGVGRGVTGEERRQRRVGALHITSSRVRSIRGDRPNHARDEGDCEDETEEGGQHLGRCRTLRDGPC